MRYVEIPPGSELRPFIRCFWFLEGGTGPGGPPANPEPVLPDGCPELIVNLADPFLDHTGAAPLVQPPFLVVGQITGPLTLAPGGRVELAAVRFEPGGALPFLGLPLRELTDRAADARALQGGFVGDCLPERLAERRRPTARARVLEEHFGRLLCRDHAPPHPLVAPAVRALGRPDGRVSVSAVARELGVTARHLERLFLDHVGVGPKLLARIARFQRVFREIEAGSPGWAAVAVRCGYSDQSHLVRDFREFAGRSPEAFLCSGFELSGFFTGADLRTA